jgi:hypothetical protein
MNSQILKSSADVYLEEAEEFFKERGYCSSF